MARASLEELLADYRDFLRVRGLQEWPLEHAYVNRLRELIRTPGASYATFRKGIENPDPAIPHVPTLRYEYILRIAKSERRAFNARGAD